MAKKFKMRPHNSEEQKLMKKFMREGTRKFGKNEPEKVRDYIGEQMIKIGIRVKVPRKKLPPLNALKDKGEK